MPGSDHRTCSPCAVAIALGAIVVLASGCSLVTGFGDLVFDRRDAGASGDATLDAPMDARIDGQASVDAATDTPRPDARSDAGDGGSGCVATACDDGIACTEDRCADDGTCESIARDDLCGAGSTCDLDRRGCVGGGCAADGDCNDGVVCTDDRCDVDVCVFAARRCADDDPCTVDRCVAATGECSHDTAPDDVRCDATEASLRCCAGACVDTSRDATACGGCGTACAVNEACKSGMCQCDVGFQSCDGEPGCESRPSNDAQHCGDCATVCPEAEPTCAEGECTACVTAADCADDGLACTSPPTCTSGRCEHALRPASCLIDGQCRGANEHDPRDDCRACLPATSTTTWSPRTGQTCDDGDRCTSNDSCSDGGACDGQSVACEDGVVCTVDECDPVTGMCTHTPTPTGCAIGMGCYAPNERNPSNACQVCDPVRSRDSWSIFTGACDDGLFCTMGDTCAPAPTGPGCIGGMPRNCDDGRSCTTDTCNEALDTCVGTPSSNVCYFDTDGDGAPNCVANGAVNPANSCQHCDAQTNNLAWTERMQGDACDSGAGVCCGGMCTLRALAPCSCLPCAIGTCCGGTVCCEAPAICCPAIPLCCAFPPCPGGCDF